MTLFTQKKFRVGDKSVYNNPKHLGAKLAQNWPNEQTSAALDLGKGNCNIVMFLPCRKQRTNEQ